MDVLEGTERQIKAVETALANGKISQQAATNIRKWLEQPQYADFRSDIDSLISSKNWNELNDCFYTIIPFGTGGRRGPMGPGPNRMNTRTVGESTQGLCQYILEFGEEAAQRGVVIAHDTRHNSREFAEETARVVAGNGIKAYLFDSFRPTPELSFAVRHCGAQAGVVISASHNPPSDNGYKVYWDDGAQIVHPHDSKIIDNVNSVVDIEYADIEEAEQKGLLEYIGSEIDAAFISTVDKLALTQNRAARVVYSPLHGTGAKTVVPVLKQAGFEAVHIVEEQANPDPDFSTVPDQKPNPEEPQALDILMQHARDQKADIALATDPDADRVACGIEEALPDGTTRWTKLTGNQVACLICHFTLSQLKEQNKLPEKGVVVRTIVTTQQLDEIAASFGAEVINHLLVGFKYIGEAIRTMPEGKTFLFGAEESLGYLRGTYARDKDSAIGALILAELAATLKKEGRTPMQYLNDLYRQYGYYSEKLSDIYLTGQQGSEQIKKIMSTLREDTPTEISGRAVESITDRLTLTTRNLKTGEETGDVEGIKGNLLLLHLDGNCRVAVRPSGTEPKAKFYVTVRRDVPQEISENELFELKNETDALADELMSDVHSLAQRIATS